MKRLLNEHTGTVHRVHPETTIDETACGALRHVPRQKIAVIGAGETKSSDEITRCGRCFEDGGGY